jgi:predicted dehydrogenase
MESPPTPLGSYDELINSEQVQALYLPLPTGLRKEWVIRAAEAGKHVLCEKPCAVSIRDLDEMLDACRQNGVQLMDGVMFVHSARLQKLQEVLSDPTKFGGLRRITSAFSFRGSDDFFAGNIRANAELEPFGCLGDLGWYCIRLALWAMNWQMPVEVSGRLLSQTQQGVPTEFSAELIFPGGISSGFYCSFVAELQQWAILSGTQGSVHVGDFVLPVAGDHLEFNLERSDLQKKGCDFRMHRETTRFTVPEWSHGHPTAQEVNCFRNFADQIRSGQLNQLWPESALKTQTVMCACLDSARNGRITPIS